MAIGAESVPIQPRLHELQRRRVWEGWFTSEARAQYFTELSGQYHRHNTVAIWVSLVFSSGAVASIIPALGTRFPWLAPMLALVASAFTFYIVTTQREKKATDARDLYLRWSELADRYRGIWENMYDENAVSYLADLDEKAIDLGRLGTFFPNDEKLMRKAYARVERSLTALTSQP